MVILKLSISLLNPIPMNIHSISDDIDPFEFCCDHCGNTKLFTETEIEKIKQKTPNTENDYFILCHFCKFGHMLPPVFVSTDGIFQ